ncbi:MAG: cyclic lactone autoinducer peptide [Oscillospiraceae bacterium]|nr:cyclic lactone autoinducer peptide [Oscillospiraceae bacterium]
MKHKIASMILKMSGSLAALALIVTSVTANAACMWLTYQEEMPADAKQLRKF